MTHKILLVSLLSLCAAQASATSFTNLPGGPAWPSGVGVHNGSGYSQWRAWTGYDPDIVMVFLPSDSTYMGSWEKLAACPTSSECNSYLIGTHGAFSNVSVTTPVIISTPMIPNASGLSTSGCKNLGTWDNFAAGSYDAHWTTFFSNLKKVAQNAGRNPANTVIRLGWEMNGNWYPWSVCNKTAQFKTAWARVHDIAESIIPGILFDVSVAQPYTGYTAGYNYGGGAGCNLACQLPASSKFDTISPSVHDGLPNITSEANWQVHLVGIQGTSQKWMGLNEVVSTAKALEKKIGLTEYAINYEDCFSPWFKSQDPVFALSKYFEFLNANASIVAWDTYFAPGCNALHFPDRQTSPVAKKYKELWGSGNRPPVAPRAPALLSLR